MLRCFSSSVDGRPRDAGAPRGRPRTETLNRRTARAEGQDVAGTATTAFTFKDAGLDQPKVPVVLSVADTIKLEYDFRFVRQ